MVKCTTHSLISVNWTFLLFPFTCWFWISCVDSSAYAMLRKGLVQARKGREGQFNCIWIFLGLLLQMLRLASPFRGASLAPRFILCHIPRRFISNKGSFINKVKWYSTNVCDNRAIIEFRRWSNVCNSFSQTRKGKWYFISRKNNTSSSSSSSSSLSHYQICFYTYWPTLPFSY